MMQDFRDETIGFRCANSTAGTLEEEKKKPEEFTGNQSSRGSKTRPK
jgi:hypothetical protein